MFKQFIFAFVGYFLIQYVVLADAKNTTISLDIGHDEQENQNSLLSANIFLANSKEIFFGLGKSDTQSGSEVIDNKISYLGLSKKFQKDLKVTGLLEYSGLKDTFTIFSTSAAVRYTQDNYFLELVPALRRVTLTTISNREASISSKALGFKSGVFIGNHFRLSGSAYRYDYSRDVSVLASFVSTLFFNDKTLALSSGLLEKSYNLEAGLDYDSFSISLGKNRSISAIDGQRNDYVYTVVDYYISDAWALSLLLGEYLDSPENQNNYSSLTVSYSF